ncbi:MAG: type I glutamate--ammonia ligase [Candidatus Coatesbacteria bacterium]|nr:MAG: type I glutamate--ammonia ligase [Candidatus Coatesbacteria bacterium]
MNISESVDRLNKMIEDVGASFIDLKFCDLYGRWHHLTIDTSIIGEKLFTVGIGIDGSSMGYKSIESGDLTIIPDINTAFVDPFYDLPTISMICDITESSIEKPFHLDPRFIARKCESYLSNTVNGATALFSPEFEFYLFDEVEIAVKPHYSCFSLLSLEEDETGRGADIRHQEGYHHIPPADAFNNFRNNLSMMLKEANIPLKYHHHEVGAMGQQEIELGFLPLLNMADNVMLVKYFVRNLAYKEGISATFMPKPIQNASGSGMHIHLYLEKDGNSLFYDGSKPSCLSDTGMKYIGGILKNGKALFAFTNPSVNSYKRLCPHYEAPEYLFHSEANRTAAIRIPSYAKNPQEMRIEYRPSDATANPYLSFSALLLAGLYGIRTDIQAPDPVVGDFESQPSKVKKRFDRVPSNLKEALDALKREHEFLMVDNIFTEELINAWILLKSSEIDMIEKGISPMEFYLYYDT